MALVDRIQCGESPIEDIPLGVVDRELIEELVHGHVVGDRIDHEPGRVPHAGGAQDGQYQVGAGPQAVEAQRLAEVLVFAFDPVLHGRHVDEPGQPHRGVDDDPGGGVERFDDLELQQGVGEVGDFGQVSEKIGDPCLREIRQHELVGAHDRQKEILVEDGVEVVNPAVHRLPGVPGIECVGDSPFDVFADGPLGGYFRFLAYRRRPAAGQENERREQHEAQSAFHKSGSFQFLKTLSM